MKKHLDVLLLKQAIHRKYIYTIFILIHQIQLNDHI